MLYKKLPHVGAAFCALLMLPGCWPTTEEKKEAKQEQAEEAAPQQKGISDVRNVASVDEFNAILKEGKPTVADFFAQWCGPCQQMKPIVHAAAAKYGDKVNFVMIDNDDKNVSSLFDKHGVDSFPTFVLFDASGKQVEKVSGGRGQAEFNKLVDKVAGNP